MTTLERFGYIRICGAVNARSITITREPKEVDLDIYLFQGITVPLLDYINKIQWFIDKSKGIIVEPLKLHITNEAGELLIEYTKLSELSVNFTRDPYGTYIAKVRVRMFIDPNYKSGITEITMNSGTLVYAITEGGYNE